LRIYVTEGDRGGRNGVLTNRKVSFISEISVYEEMKERENTYCI
jgi:hypothetical protein